MAFTQFVTQFATTAKLRHLAGIIGSIRVQYSKLLKDDICLGTVRNIEWCTCHRKDWLNEVRPSTSATTGKLEFLPTLPGTCTSILLYPPKLYLWVAWFARHDKGIFETARFCSTNERTCCSSQEAAFTHTNYFCGNRCSQCLSQGRHAEPGFSLKTFKKAKTHMELICIWGFKQEENDKILLYWLITHISQHDNLWYHVVIIIW